MYVDVMNVGEGSVHENFHWYSSRGFPFDLIETGERFARQENSTSDRTNDVEHDAKTRDDWRQHMELIFDCLYCRRLSED